MGYNVCILKSFVREKKIKISNKMHIKHILILALMIGVAHSRSYKAAMLGAEETDECDDCGLGFTCCLNDDGQGHVCCAHSLGFWCCKDKYGTGYCTMPWEDCP